MISLFDIICVSNIYNLPMRKPRGFRVTPSSQIDAVSEILFFSASGLLKGHNGDLISYGRLSNIVDTKLKRDTNPLNEYKK